MKRKFYCIPDVLKMPVSAVFKGEYFSEVPESWNNQIGHKKSTAAIAARKFSDVTLRPPAV